MKDFSKEKIISLINDFSFIEKSVNESQWIKGQKSDNRVDPEKCLDNTNTPSLIGALKPEVGGVLFTLIRSSTGIILDQEL